MTHYILNTIRPLKCENIKHPRSFLSRLFLHSKCKCCKFIRVIWSSLCGVISIGFGCPGVIRGPELGEGHSIPQLWPAVGPGQGVGQCVWTWRETKFLTASCQEKKLLYCIANTFRAVNNHFSVAVPRPLILRLVCCQNWGQEIYVSGKSRLKIFITNSP